MTPTSSPELSPRLVVRGPARDARRTSPGRRLHRATAALLALGLIVGITMSGGGASAQTVDSLRARAQQLATELDDLERQGLELNERFLELSEQLNQLEAEQAENRTKVDEARIRVEATRGQAAGYIVEAYIGAGSSAGIALGSADPNEAVNSQVMLEYLRTDREVAADEFAASKSDLEARSAELGASTAELQASKERQAAVVATLEANVDRHDELLNSTNSQLNEALAAERARREAAEAARVEAAAREAAATRAAAATAAAASAAARTNTTAAPRSSGPQRSSASPARPSAAPTPAPASAPAAAAPAPAPVSSPNGRASAAIAAATSRLGTPYRWGGTTPSGFDCSGLMLWSWANAGVSLPRTSGAQKASTQRISRDQLQPGDLVFSGSPVHHVGMYIGGGQMIHSPRTGDVTKISTLRADSFGRIR